MSSRRKIHFKINGQERTEEVEVRKSLADFLRQDLTLTGTHVGCEHGVCGACTVLVGGQPVRSCLMLAVQVDGSEVMTVEGLSSGSNLHPIQEAFWESHGLQCGFCTPGILMTLKSFLEEETDPSEESLREVLSGHLCRCTGYGNIVKAGLLAAAKLRRSGRGI